MAVTNLDEAGRNLRRRSGIIGAAGALMVTWIVVGVIDSPHDVVSLKRLIVFPFYFLAASGFLQARTGTCVARARRGEREEAGCAIRIDDAETAAQLRAVARKIQIQSLLVAAAATAGVLYVGV
jgi:hypothetical protein